jgi:hypothetical protein
MPSIVRFNSPHRILRVKNLGWLLRHWKEVTHFTVSSPLSRRAVYDCYLYAHLTDNRCYESDFASTSLLWRWLQRPIFLGLTVRWFYLGEYRITRGAPQPSVSSP